MTAPLLDAESRRKAAEACTAALLAQRKAAEACSTALAARKDALELFGQLGGVAVDVAACRREVRGTKIWNAGMIALAVAAIGGITQVQVARINAIRPIQDAVAAEQQRQKDAELIEHRLASRLDQMQTEIERVRRNAPQPLERNARP